MNLRDKLSSVFILLVLFVLIFEGIIIFQGTALDKGFSQILIIQLLIIYLFTLYTSFRKFGLGSIFTLFLLCLGLFNFQKFFWDSILNLDFRRAESLISINLSEIVVQKTLFIYIVFTTIIFLSYNIFTNRRDASNESISNLVSEPKLYRIGLIIFIIFLPFTAFKSYLEFIDLFGKSFTEYYTEESSLSTPLYLRLFALMFQVAYMIILASIPKRQNYLIISGLYILTIVPYLLIGLRANFAVSLIFMFWYYINIYNIKVRIKRLVVPLILLLSVLQLVAIKRNLNVNDSISFFKLIPTFLYDQSQSMYVLSLYMQYYDDIIHNQFPYLLDPLTSWMYPSGQSLEVVNSRSSLGHHLTYSLSPGYYMSGSSLGTNFIAELYEFGLIAIILGAVFFAYFISAFEKLVFKKRVYLFLSLIILQYFFIAPRSGFLPSIYFIFRVLLIYYCILVIFRLYSRKYFI